MGIGGWEKNIARTRRRRRQCCFRIPRYSIVEYVNIEPCVGRQAINVLLLAGVE